MSISILCHNFNLILVRIIDGNRTKESWDGGLKNGSRDDDGQGKGISEMAGFFVVFVLTKKFCLIL